MIPNLNCDKDCRFQTHSYGTTCMYFPPTYDKYGNNLNPDGNITSGEVFCTVCKRKWTSSTQYGKTRYMEVTDAS